jgi:hypothetical protein
VRTRLLVLLTLAVIAPSISAAQKRSTPAPGPRRADTVVVALASTDTVAAAEVDRVVRGHHREMEFCFEESGLKTDPELSGTFGMALTIDSLGGVSRVDATHREWTGPDGAAVEVCVMERARAWKFPVQVAVAPGRHEIMFRFAK